MGFALGLLAGAAKSADKILQKDIEQSRLMTRQLASKRAEREEASRLKYIKDRQEADENIKRAIGRIGDRGADVFQFLMDKHGYAGALEILPEYEKNAKYFGDGSIANMLGLVERATGEAPTIDYLSSMAVPRPIKAQPVKTQPLSFLDKLTARDMASDVERMAQRQLNLSGIPAIPEGMAQIDVVGTDRPDFRLRDDYSLKSQKEFVTSRLAFVTNQLAKENLSQEQREKLLTDKNSLVDKLGVYNRAELESAGSLLDFEKEFMRLTALAERTTDPKKKAEYKKQAQETAKLASAWSTATSTKHTGSKGIFLRQLYSDIPKDASSDTFGYDPRKPMASLAYQNEAGRTAILSGTEATKMYNESKYRRILRFKQQHLSNPDLLDVNGRDLLKAVDQDIKELQGLLNIGQENNPPPGPPPGSEDRNNIMTDTEVGQNGITTMGGSNARINEDAFDDEALTVTGGASPIQIEGYGSGVQNYVNQNPTAVRILMEEYSKVKDLPLSADYNRFMSTMASKFNIDQQDAAELAQELFEKTRPVESEEPTTPTTNTTNRRNRIRNRGR